MFASLRNDISGQSYHIRIEKNSDICSPRSTSWPIPKLYTIFLNDGSGQLADILDERLNVRFVD
jgi:hypothetical protein